MMLKAVHGTVWCLPQHINHVQRKFKLCTRFYTSIWSTPAWYGIQLTDGLYCTTFCSSNSHHILSSHWHTVIGWGRIWGWLKGVGTPPSCAPGNVHSSCKRCSVETDLVMCDVPNYTWTCLPWVNWVLEGYIQIATKLKDANEWIYDNMS